MKKQFIILLFICIIISGCQKSIDQPVSGNLNQNVLEDGGKDSTSIGVDGNIDNTDMIDMKVYENEEYGFGFKYPKEWNLYQKSNEINPFNVTIVFTYDEIKDNIEPIDNMVNAVVSISKEASLNNKKDIEEVYIGNNKFYQYKSENMEGGYSIGYFAKINEGYVIYVSERLLDNFYFIDK